MLDFTLLRLALVGLLLLPFSAAAQTEAGGAPSEESTARPASEAEAEVQGAAPGTAEDTEAGPPAGAPPMEPSPMLSEEPASGDASEAQAAHDVSAAADASKVTETEPEADKEKKVSFWVGGRVGYALPGGDAYANQALDDMVSSAIPIVIEGTALHTSGFELGLLARFTIMNASDAFDRDCADCSLFGGRLGAELNKHLIPRGAIDPWLGVTLGVELLSTSREFQATGITTNGNLVSFDAAVSRTLTALPDVGVQGGLEFGSEAFRIGPYAAFTLAVYGESESEVECREAFGCPVGFEGSVTSDVNDTAFHMWLTFGVRGGYIL